MNISTSSPMEHLRAFALVFLAGVATTAATGLVAWVAARRERGL